MASRLEPDVQDRLLGGADRGLWFCVFDPGGHSPLPAGGRARRVRGRDGSDRLALYLLGPSAPGHPSMARSGPLEVLVAGRLYNPDDLVGGRKPPPPDRSNARVVLEAYRRRGLDALAAARGVFAVVIFDSEQDLLVAARDQLGMHPLFVSESGGGLVLSASVQGVLAHDGVPRTVSR